MLFRFIIFRIRFSQTKHFWKIKFFKKIELDNQKYKRPVVKNLLLRLVFSQFDLYHLKLETRILWHTTSKSEKKCRLSSLDCLWGPITRSGSDLHSSLFSSFGVYLLNNTYVYFFMVCLVFSSIYTTLLEET